MSTGDSRVKTNRADISMSANDQEEAECVYTL